MPHDACHLQCQYDSALLALEESILSRQPQIEAWFREQWRLHTPPFYGSVDLRNSGYKLAPVDMNLFPGGFNNLNPQFIPLAVAAAQDAVERACHTATSVMLIPENHTRNTYYLQNVHALSQILIQAGFNVRVGTINPEITAPTEFTTALGKTLLLEPVRRVGDRLQLADGFNPCLVLLNNDLSAGAPELLQGLSQQVRPPLHGGWTTRRKTHHFAAYDKVASAFAEVAGIDAWRINPYFEQCTGLDFQSREGEDELAATVERLLAKIQAKYDAEGITDKPFVIVKADAGTYGMGVMSVKSPEDVRALNRKNRNKMAVVKEGLEVSEVIVQEGVYTYEKVGNAVAEPVVYMLDRFVIGGFNRVHEGRGVDENLNASGMKFVPIEAEFPMPNTQTRRAFTPWETIGVPQADQAPDEERNRLYVYGVIARLSLLAAALELEEQL